MAILDGEDEIVCDICQKITYNPFGERWFQVGRAFIDPPSMEMVIGDRITAAVRVAHPAQHIRTCCSPACAGKAIKELSGRVK